MMAIFGTILAATLSTGVEIPDGGVPVNDGGRQYTVRMEKRPAKIADEATCTLWVPMVTTRNVFGNFYTYAVGLTHFFPQKPRGTFEDVVIENIFAAKALSPEDIGVRSRANFPLVWLEGPVDAGSVTIRNFARTEKTVPVATVRIDKEATARCLTVRDCRMANELDERIPFIENLGKVEVLTCENNDFAGEWKSLGERMCESRRFTSRAVASRAE